METPSGKEASRKRMSPRMLNVLTALIGLVTLALGVGWLIYTRIVDLEVPYFAIPLVLTVPVIVAVAFRNCWD
jgi:Na+/glutamate symporter